MPNQDPSRPVDLVRPTYSPSVITLDWGDEAEYRALDVDRRDKDRHHGAMRAMRAMSNESNESAMGIPQAVIPAT